MRMNRLVVADLPFCSAAASCFINLVIKESSNNDKLIVLDCLDTLLSKHGHIIDSLIMDVLQGQFSCSAALLSLTVIM